MEIIYYPHPTLFKKQTKIPEFNEELEQKIEQMFQLMYEAKGIGLAAPQVGSSIQNRLPPPGRPSTPTEPFMRVMPRLTMASPTPVPG